MILLLTRNSDISSGPVVAISIAIATLDSPDPLKRLFPWVLDGCTGRPDCITLRACYTAAPLKRVLPRIALRCRANAAGIS